MNGNLAGQSYKFCRKCGYKSSTEDLFCTKCGYSYSDDMVPILNNSNNSQNSSYVDTNNESLLECEYIKQNIEYYEQKFAKLREKKGQITWNWAAFLAGPCWFIYRKMYAWGYGMLAVSYLAKFISNYIPFFNSVLNIAFIGYYIALGIIGNSLYMNRINKLANENSKLSEQSKAEHIAKNGGVNSSLTIITVIAILIFAVIISVIIE